MKKFLFIAIIFAMVSMSAFSQETKKETKAEKQAKQDSLIRQLVESQDYDFVAQSAIPTGGRTLQLTSDYTLKVRKDSLIADLPYYGKAFTADIGGTGGGITFKTTDFSYEKKDGKKGSWDITIKPKDVTSTNQMSLHISSAGYASIMVMSNSRENISFYGYIRPKKYGR
ncbi:MAG: hypothetical protein C5B52_18815 [Bacteroidetes bacterium]|nr:MAG: hypothetical protein C5B52_18815 [Bacteroidota bacterium]